MLRLTAKKVNNDDWAHTFVDDNDYDTLIDEEAEVLKGDGSLLLRLHKKAVPEEMCKKLIALSKTVGLSTNNRGTAIGIKGNYRKKMDGTTSKTFRVQLGWEVDSGIIGFFERTARWPYAHATSWTANNRHLHDSIIVPLAESVTEIFKLSAPDHYQYQKSIVDKTCPEYVIGKSVYTTITFNRNFRTACHLDAGDLDGGRSSMLVLEHGHYEGGVLVLPNYRVGVNIRHGDVIVFDPHEYHGNTQIVPVQPGSMRFSVVFYYRDLIRHSLPAEQELELAKNRKPGDPLFPKE